MTRATGAPTRGELAAMLRIARATPRAQASTRQAVALASFVAVLASTGLIWKDLAIFRHAETDGAFLTTRAGEVSGRTMTPHEEMKMRGFNGVMVGAALALSSSALAQDAVQWRVEDGGNGHWYRVCSVSPLPASRTAQESFASGLGGTMATIDSPQENSFILQLLSDLGSGEAFSVWIGLYRASIGAPWVWTDETLPSWFGWGGAGCASGPYPNDLAHPEELGVAIYRQNCGLIWDDTPTGWIANPPGWWVSSANMRLLVEWSADCNSDSIVDYGQIRAGELDDVNSNNIPDCCEQGVSCNCPADVDGSGAVNGVDLAAILNVWGTSGGKYPGADVNADGVVNAADLSLVLNAWGPCP